MRRVIAAVALVLLLAPEAMAQTTGGVPVRTVPTEAEIAAQASFGTGYLLALYMAQLAAQGTPPSPADIDEAARLYLTNGAAAAGVPSSGPRAAYFTNGAQVMAYPASPPSPPVEAVQDAGGGAELGAEDAGPALAAPAEASPASEVPSAATATVVAATTPREAASALASQPPAPSPPPPAPPAAIACPPPPTISTAATAPAPAPLVSAVEAPRCPGPSVFSRVAPALGGALFGALTAVLWSRPRTVRVTHARKVG